MKVGIRKPSIKKSISARTTGKAKRKLKRITNPFYGKKGWVSLKILESLSKQKYIEKQLFQRKVLEKGWADVYGHVA